jgi:hypothetical protein
VPKAGYANTEEVDGGWGRLLKVFSGSVFPGLEDLLVVVLSILHGRGFANEWEAIE